MSEPGQPDAQAVMPASGLTKFADSIEAFIKPIYTWLAYIGAAVLAGLVLAMVWSIVGRRFLNAPLKGSTEITQLALAVMTFLVLGLEHMGHEKMTVDLVIKHFSKRAAGDHRSHHLHLGHRHLLHPMLAVGGVGKNVPGSQPDAAQSGRAHISVRLPGGVWNPHHDSDLYSPPAEILGYVGGEEMTELPLWAIGVIGAVLFFGLMFAEDACRAVADDRRIRGHLAVERHAGRTEYLGDHRVAGEQLHVSGGDPALRTDGHHRGRGGRHREGFRDLQQMGRPFPRRPRHGHGRHMRRFWSRLR